MVSKVQLIARAEAIVEVIGEFHLVDKVMQTLKSVDIYDMRTLLCIDMHLTDVLVKFYSELGEEGNVRWAKARFNESFNFFKSFYNSSSEELHDRNQW